MNHSGLPPLFLLLTSGTPVLRLEEVGKRKQNEEIFFSVSCSCRRAGICIMKLTLQTVFLRRELCLDFRDCSFANWKQLLTLEKSIILTGYFSKLFFWSEIIFKLTFVFERYKYLSGFFFVVVGFFFANPEINDHFLLLLQS